LLHLRAAPGGQLGEHLSKISWHVVFPFVRQRLPARLLSLLLLTALALTAWWIISPQSR
jgi:hypothetical protein